jgi:hypothetical protein
MTILQIHNKGEIGPAEHYLPLLLIVGLHHELQTSE